MKEVILLKYGEIILKGQNKRTFEELLLRNIRYALSFVGKPTLDIRQSTVFVSFEEDADLDEAVTALSRVFGVTAVCRSLVCPYDFDEMKVLADEYLKSELCRAKTFKVIAKRSVKSYPLTSPQIGEKLGEYLLEQNPGLRAQMEGQELTVYAEVREGGIYVHANPVRGAGGLPCGCGGHGLLMLSGGIDSPVAGYMMARRGMRISAIHFESPPYTSERARQNVEKLARQVSRYSGKINLYIVQFTEIQEKIRKNCREDLFTVIMRRMMLRIALTVADQHKAGAIITGESLGQVASQTLEAIICTDAVSPLPVFRPCIGLDKSDIIDLARRIDTFETSIEPYEDCCTVFTPRHPRTKPSLAEIEKEEAKLDLADMIENVVIEKEEERA